MLVAPLLLVAATLRIDHQALACFVKDRFPLVDATIEPSADVQKARIYFKAAKAEDYHFVEMTLTLGRFVGKLPKPKEKAGTVVYYVDVLHADGTTRRTPDFSAEVVKRRDACPNGGVVAAEGSDGDVKIYATTASRTKPEGFSGIAAVVELRAPGAAAAATSEEKTGEAPPATMPSPAPTAGPTPTPTKPPNATPDSDYLVGPQDILKVTVYGHDDLTQTVVVQSDGTFVYPLVGRVKASDMTTRELERKIGVLLSQGFIRNPQISILVQEYHSKMVFVVGELAKPGTYSLAESRTIVELLAKAGPLTANAGAELVIVRPLSDVEGPVLPTDVAEGTGSDSAAKKQAEVIRLDVRDLTSGNLERNVELRPHDTVFVPQASKFFVSGEVKNPGTFPLTPGLTVNQAIIVAGGFTDRAATNRLRALRLVEGKSKEFKIKPDDPVQPGDTIVVKEKLF